MAGVSVRIVTPEGCRKANRDKVLLNLHGGGFNSDSGSYTESIPIASYTKIKVVAVLYRLAPEFPFPAAVDDSVAVYKELLKTTSRTTSSFMELLPGDPDCGSGREAEATGVAAAGGAGHLQRHGRLARAGDSASMYALRGLSGHLDAPAAGAHDTYYSGSADLKDPVLSPIYADLQGLPPRCSLPADATCC